MRGMKSKLLALMMAFGLSDGAFAQQRNADCFPNVIKMDMCAEAAKLQAAAAPNLPQKVSADMTLLSAIAVGPRLSLTVRWDLTRGGLTAALAAANLTLDQFVSRITAGERAYVCGNPPTAAFVRLGGSVTYMYQTADGSTIASPLVTACPG
jgi:hypothetical protein